MYPLPGPREGSGFEAARRGNVQRSQPVCILDPSGDLLSTETGGTLANGDENRGQNEVLKTALHQGTELGGKNSRLKPPGVILH